MSYERMSYEQQIGDMSNMADKNEPEITIEEAFAQIDGILEEMEDESVSLEKSFELYQKGISLVKKCNETIEKVEKQVLVLNDQGETDEF